MLPKVGCMCFIYLRVHRDLWGLWDGYLPTEYWVILKVWRMKTSRNGLAVGKRCEWEDLF